MQPDEDFHSTISKEWAPMTLEDLRFKAESQATGVAYVSLRVKDCERGVIVLAVTDADQVSQLEKALDLNDDGLVEDWSILTIADVAMRTAKGNGLNCEALRDERGRRCAIVLSATTPVAIRTIEAIFEFPDLAWLDQA